MEKLKRASSTSRRAIITRKEILNRGDKEACMGVISKKLYELVLFLQSYDVKKVEPDRCDVGVDNKSID